MDNNVLFIASQILDSLLQGKILSHEDLIEYIKKSICVIPSYSSLTTSQINELAFKYEQLYGGKTFVPSNTLKGKDANDIWFFKKKKEMSIDDHKFEKRYRDYLTMEHFGKNAVDAIINETEKVLSLCSDPESNEKKRGLVIGDVQSGKTSNYLALANLACDYGYKIVLILAGLTDSLRLQTQERVDEGIIGAISNTIGKDKISYVGVGKFACEHYAIPLTTIDSDFSSLSATSNDFAKPQVLVVKKNKSVLTNVKKWLKPGQANISSRNILIIDDECDNASVNTKSDEDPSIINALIRDIYNNFNCATYVGYTATPFANIFINPEKKVGYDDLFPSDFIHRLHSSNESYFGASKVFGNSALKHVEILDEYENKFLPPKHKKDYNYEGLSESLKNAICDFLICNCIRTIRGDGLKHRTMMINISSYNCIQEDIKESVELYVGNLLNIIFQYDKYPMEKFLNHKEMKRIYNIFKTSNFYNLDSESYPYLPLNQQYTFENIKKHLFEEISKFRVAIINNKYKGDQRFRYDDYKETGARVIVIGGFVLSRGLTLSGLMTSYYSRNASSYDSLLQMCRWFGYRPNYEDLCKIYMSQISYDSFGAVIDSINNLDEQLEMMSVQGKAPIDFGIMIKECPDTLETKLLITARNKMKNTIVLTRGLNYSGESIDTSKLYKDVKNNNHNFAALKIMYEKLTLEGKILEVINGRHMFKDVSPDYISEFISTLHIPLENKKFEVVNISNFIREAKYYKKWDIVFATGEKGEIPNFKLYDLDIPPVKRKFECRNDESIIRISKNNNRLLEPGIFNSGLTNSQIEEAKKIAGKRKNLIAKDYLSVSERNPLLVILPIYLSVDKEDSEQVAKMKIKLRDSFGKYVLGFGIGFAGKDGKVYMDFRLNKIKQAEYKKSFDDEEDEVID